MGQLTDEQLNKAKSFILARDRMANILGQATIAFEKQKAHCIQQIELTNYQEQAYMAELAREHGIDPNTAYTLDYNTGILRTK